jgi:hypothetical protein
VGAWGSGPFENDDASDWVWELEDDTDGTVLVDAFTEVLELPDDEYIEAPECSNAIAAAEIVVSARGSRTAGLPTEATAWLDAHAAVIDDRIAGLATAAVRRIAADSELKELWEEANDSSWAEGVASLQARLPA